ncbi:hypothetical protein [Sellimonas catena]|uniref:Uncharacterized protein n=1 Tax=Sellimonas catena TaxID=2994035 RepID=A0A9W6CH45_9FIRM|nr:hypothetical protein [Sellimonas catena]GLG91292.1 hypothetical protein Selli2_27190 [Sellimonas catena]
MEQAKRRIRICLICVVTSAVILGILYYVMSQQRPVSEENGTLVSVSMEEGGNNGNIRTYTLYQRGEK